ncbi:MAG: hypothetical protein HC859_00085 [Bacteroidia bacterium]|nr:hypothetical protein [Bacteroidia bacterium]
MAKKVLGTTLLTLFTALTVVAQSPKSAWVDSVFQAMDADDKIGQMMMVPVYPSLGEDHIEEIEDQIKSHTSVA